MSPAPTKFTLTIPYRICDGLPENEPAARAHAAGTSISHWRSDHGSVADRLFAIEAARRAHADGRFTIARRRGYWLATLDMGAAS